MKDVLDHIPPSHAKSNPRAASVRVETCTLSRARAQKRHDFRLGAIPAYVDQDRMNLNRTLVSLRPFPAIRDENVRLRERAGRIRKMKSNAAVVLSGIITFGHIAAYYFEALEVETQDAAFRELATKIADKLNTSLEELVVHRDETTIHAHFMIRAYDNAGFAVSDQVKLSTTAELQDLTHRVLSRFHPGIERGHRKRDRLAAGACYADTLHRSVRQLHQDLPAEIGLKEARVEALKAEEVDLVASIDKTRMHLAKLQDDQRILTEKEEKRLKVYEERLDKKEVELAALMAQQQGEKVDLAALRAQLDVKTIVLIDRDATLKSKEGEAQDRDRKLSLREAEESMRRKELVRAGEELIARERDLDIEASQVAEQRANYEAGLIAMNSVLNEINEGTMRINPATDKLDMARPEAVKAMPFSLRESLMKPAVRLVRLIDKTEKRHAWLGEMIGKVKRWLGRDDLTVEARKDGEDIAREIGPE